MPTPASPVPGPVSTAVLVVLAATGSLGGWKTYRGELGSVSDFFKQMSAAAVEDVSEVSHGAIDAHVDTDGDGVPDSQDKFPNDPNEHKDSDDDGVGDNADAFPHDGRESKDSDGDGLGDRWDKFPHDPTEQEDTDGDGVGDNADEDPRDHTKSTRKEVTKGKSSSAEIPGQKEMKRALPPPPNPGDKASSAASFFANPPETIQAIFNPPRQLLVESVEKYTALVLPEEWKQPHSWAAIGVTYLVIDIFCASMVCIVSPLLPQDRGETQ